MGAFIVNLNVRSDTRGPVERRLADLKVESAWVTGPKNGWVTVYEERASEQDERRIRELGERLSEALDVPLIAFMVHDSDFVCYWLFQGGRLQDEYNSCPDYFDDDAPDTSQTQGRPGILLRYCAPGTQLADVERVLNDKDSLFSEDQLDGLAKLLGIDPERAQTDYNSIARYLDPTKLDAVFVGTKPPPAPTPGPQPPSSTRAGTFSLLTEEGERVDLDTLSHDEEGEGPASSPRGGLASRFMQMMGLGKPLPQADPKVERLVQAAAENDVAQIAQLVAEGADIGGQAPLKLSLKSSPVPPGILSAASLPFPVTPLLAALGNKQVDAARRLIELGADVNAGHPMYGTPAHVAAASGLPELLKLVLEAGGNPNALNAHRMTPLGFVKYFRQMIGQLGNLSSLSAVLGGNLKAKWEKVVPQAEALDECERLLREHGGQ